MQRFLKFPLRHFLFCAALFVTILIYLPSLSSKFVFDDVSNIIDSEFIKISDLSISSLLSSTSTGGDVNGRPLAMMTLAVNYYFNALDPYGYKAVNLAIHLVTGMLIYILVTSLLRTSNLEEFNDEASQKYMPFWVTLLWLVFPINFLPVVYVVQRMASMAALFTVAGMVLYVKMRQQEKNVGRVRNPLWIGGILIVFVLAVLSKESGVLLVLHLVALEVFFFRFSSNTKGGAIFLKLMVALVLVIPVCFVISYLIKYPDYFQTSYLNRDFTVYERTLTEFRIVVTYLKQMLLPVLGDFSLHHDDIQVSQSIFQPLTTLWSIFSLIALCLLSVLWRKTSPLAAYGIMVFFIGHILESTVVALDLMYEHRNYLSSFGISLVLISFFLKLNEKKFLIKKKVGLGSAVIFVIVANSMYTTFSRANLWSNELARLQYAAYQHPSSPRINNEIGTLYAKMSMVESPYKAGLIDKSIRHQYAYTNLNKTGTEGLIGIIFLMSYHDMDISSDLLLDFEHRIGATTSPVSLVQAIEGINSCFNLKICGISKEIASELVDLALDNKSLEYSARYHGLALVAASKFYFNTLQRPDVAIPLLDKAVSSHGDEPKYLLYRARMLVASGLTELAKRDIEKLESLHDSIFGNQIDELKSALSVAI